jgi:hypothetical protein
VRPEEGTLVAEVNSRSRIFVAINTHIFISGIYLSLAG